jgi:hypothetical protein
MGYTAADLLADVAYKLQNNPRYTRAKRLDGLNRAIVKVYEYAMENNDIKTVLNPPDPTGTYLYASEFPLPQGTYYVQGVLFDGRKLTRISADEFLNTQAYSLQEQSTPKYYYIRNNLYLNLYPRPQQQKTVTLMGLFAPTDLVNDTDVPELDPRYSDAVVAYATWWCLDSQTGEGERAAAMWQMYQTARAEAKFNMNQSTQHVTLRAH